MYLRRLICRVTAATLLVVTSLVATLTTLTPTAVADGGTTCLPNDPDCLPDEEPDIPIPPHVPAPDLEVDAISVGPISDTLWGLTYKIKNVGDAPAGATTTSFKRDNALTLAEVATPALAAGQSRTASVVLSRSGCWDAIRIDVDVHNVVAERSDGKFNHDWAVARTTWPCADAARYTVRLVSMKAVKSQEAADEPYLVYGASNDANATTRSTTPIPNVFTGETVHPDQKCLFGNGVNCYGQAALGGIGISATLMEHDSGDLSEVRETIATAFDKAGLVGTILLTHWLGAVGPWIDEAIDELLAWFDDDEIGTDAWGYTPEQLADKVPLPGNTLRETLVFNNGERAAGATYWVTLELKRTS